MFHFATLVSIRKTRRQTKTDAMEKLSLQQALRKAQRDLIFCKSTYLNFYPKMAKHAYTKELNNLLRCEFQRAEVELNIPELPPKQNESKEEMQVVDLDKMMEFYDAAIEGISLLNE